MAIVSFKIWRQLPWLETQEPSTNAAWLFTVLRLVVLALHSANLLHRQRYSEKQQDSSDAA